jgi:plasmid stabilization system protein ParE
VARYYLTKKALRDVAEIVGYFHRELSASAADEIERRLLSAFRDLAEGPHLGHQRPELTSQRLLFHSAQPYVVVFRRRKQMVQVLHVIHGKRDITRLL